MPGRPVGSDREVEEVEGVQVDLTVPRLVDYPVLCTIPSHIKSKVRRRTLVDTRDIKTPTYRSPRCC